MAVSDSFRTYVLDQLSRVAPGVRGRSMFGGVGIYAGELFFALIADDTLYFKADDSNRSDFEARDLGPFRPYGEGGEVMQYYQVPDDVLEDAEALRPWAEKAIGVARRKKGGRGRRLPLVVLGLLAVSPLGCGRPTQLTVREGYVTTDDSVRLCYRIVGEGRRDRGRPRGPLSRGSARPARAGLLMTVPAACSEIAEAPLSALDASVVNGTIQFLNREGGCWAIRVGERTLYEPLNLPDELRRDGLPVRAAIRERSDVGSFCMIGPIVQVLWIRRR